MATEVQLEGVENFTPWHHHMRELAITAGVWELISGREELVQDPGAPPALPLIQGDETESLKSVILHEWATRLQAFNEQRLTFQSQQVSISVAFPLLRQTLKPALLDSPMCSSAKNPYDLYQCISNHYSESMRRAYNEKFKEYVNLKLEGCPGMTSYCNQAENLREELADLHPEKIGEDDTHFIAKLMSGLTDRYNNFIRRSPP